MKMALMLIASLTIVGCNPDDYFPTEEFVLGEDSYCSQAKDLTSCQNMGERCQSAFLDIEREDPTPIFASCVARSNPEDAEEAPTLEDAFNGKCLDLDNKYLYVTQIVSKKENVINTKVKVCHSTDRGEHTIIISCAALKSHLNHHDGKDYLGACL